MSANRKAEKGRRVTPSLWDALGALLAVLCVLTVSALLIRKGVWEEKWSKLILTCAVLLSNLTFALRKGRGEAKGAVVEGLIQGVSFLLSLCLLSAAFGNGVMEPVKNTSIAVACVVGVTLGKVTKLYKSNKNINSVIRNKRNITKRNHA